MTFTRKKRQLNRTYLSQLDEALDDFIIENSDISTQVADEVERADENVQSIW